MEKNDLNVPRGGGGLLFGNTSNRFCVRLDGREYISDSRKQ